MVKIRIQLPNFTQEETLTQKSKVTYPWSPSEFRAAKDSNRAFFWGSSISLNGF